MIFNFLHLPTVVKISQICPVDVEMKVRKNHLIANCLILASLKKYYLRVLLLLLMKILITALRHCRQEVKSGTCRIVWYPRGSTWLSDNFPPRCCMLMLRDIPPFRCSCVQWSKIKIAVCLSTHLTYTNKSIVFQ